ncbi:MAG: hypothetical protein NC043_07900 [Muribaculaceae bacterium]|nr:hypothetical protein [Muribaculaceae bacterium]
MKDARDAAMKKAEEAQKKFDADYERQYHQALLKWGLKIDAARNGQY